MRKKKILVVATSRKTRGGITAVVNAHSKGAQWSKYQIKWIEAHIDRNSCMKIFYFLRSFIQFLFLMPFYDLVHIHISTHTSAFRKSFYLIWAKILNKKIISHLHCSTPSILYQKRNKPIYRLCFNNSDVVLVLSNQWKEDVYKALGIKDNVRILYNPIVSYPTPAGNVEKKNYILFAGTIDRRKGYQDLIVAFSRLYEKYNDWQLVFAGNGEIAKAEELTKELNISSHVKFVGWVSGKEKDMLFRQASIYCLPSYAEGFPMSVLDAWAYCLPVVSSRVGGISDVAVDGENVLLFNPGDIDELVRQLGKLMASSEMRTSVAQKSFELSETKFKLENINEELGDLYKELLGE